MAVKMRLMRMGKKKSPMYRVVVVDGRVARDSRYIEQIGRYDPNQDPSLVEIDNARAADWLSKGAQPTETVEKLLNISGAMTTMKVQTGQIHTVGASAAGNAEPEGVEAMTETTEPTGDGEDESAEEAAAAGIGEEE